MLNLPSSQALTPEATVWIQLGDMLRKDSNYDVINIRPECQEILLKVHDFTLFNSEDIREILQKLQHHIQCSFVALINMSTQFVLITIRG
ncbi:MAG: hypothetical protein ACFFCZ_17995 [Promethearchaeota archaeon]